VRSGSIVGHPRRVGEKKKRNGTLALAGEYEAVASGKTERELKVARRFKVRAHGRIRIKGTHDDDLRIGE